MEEQPSTSNFHTSSNQCIDDDEKLDHNTVSADVQFSIGAMDNITAQISAHKAVLAADSDVFMEIFFGASNDPNGHSSQVHVSDSTEAEFMAFLQYFYLNKVKLTAENVVGVCHLGVKYNVKKCFDDCVQFLLDTLDNENVCCYLALAIRYDQKPLMDRCGTRIMLNTETVFASDGFLASDQLVLSHILTMDVLSCTEVQVFEACMAWVKAKIGSDDLSIELVDAHLGDSYYANRLASMTMEQLCMLQERYASVLTRDFIGIAKAIVQPQLHTSKFSKDPRHAKWSAENAIECHCTVDDDYDYFSSHYEEDRELNATEVTKFSVNKPMILGGFSCIQLSDWGCEMHPSDEMTEIEVTEANDLSGTSCKTLSTMKVALDLNEANILMPHTVLIRPDFFYEIRIGPLSRYGCSPTYLKTEIHLDSDIKVEFHKSNNDDYATCVGIIRFNEIQQRV